MTMAMLVVICVTAILITAMFCTASSKKDTEVAVIEDSSTKEIIVYVDGKEIVRRSSE
jgi:heme/copper-type cytochrome/quinol oxidase subunit 2